MSEAIYKSGTTIHQSVGQGMHIQKGEKTIDITLSRAPCGHSVDVLVSGVDRKEFSQLKHISRKYPVLTIGNIEVTMNYDATVKHRAPMVYRAPEGYILTPIR